MTSVLILGAAHLTAVIVISFGWAVFYYLNQVAP